MSRRIERARTTTASACRSSGRPTRPRSSVASPIAEDGALADDAKAYAVDALERTTLTLEVLRERAEQDIAHEEAGTPPVLIYDHEVVLDGRTLPRPPTRCCSRSFRPPGSR